LRRLRRGEYAGEGGQGTPGTTPVIVLSATADPDETYDAQAIFEKPFDLEEVISALGTLLRG
jgi:DNA-binding response OmpR family regulator